VLLGGVTLFRKQREPLAVPRLDYGEVPAVERGHLRLSESLTRDDDGGVDETQVERLVLSLELGGTNEVLLVEVVETVGATRNVVNKGLPCRGSIQLEQPVVHLDEHRRRDHQVLADFGDRRSAALMLRVGGIEQSDDRARVENERHYERARRRAGACSSPAIRWVAVPSP